MSWEKQIHSRPEKKSSWVTTWRYHDVSGAIVGSWDFDVRVRCGRKNAASFTKVSEIVVCHQLYCILVRILCVSIIQDIRGSSKIIFCPILVGNPFYMDHLKDKSLCWSAGLPGIFYTIQISHDMEKETSILLVFLAFTVPSLKLRASLPLKIGRIPKKTSSSSFRINFQVLLSMVQKSGDHHLGFL